MYLIAGFCVSLASGPGGVGRADSTEAIVEVRLSVAAAMFAEARGGKGGRLGFSRTRLVGVLEGGPNDGSRVVGGCVGIRR